VSGFSAKAAGTGAAAVATASSTLGHDTTAVDVKHTADNSLNRLVHSTRTAETASNGGQRIVRTSADVDFTDVKGAFKSGTGANKSSTGNRTGAANTLTDWINAHRITKTGIGHASGAATQPYCSDPLSTTSNHPGAAASRKQPSHAPVKTSLKPLTQPTEPQQAKTAGQTPAGTHSAQQEKHSHTTEHTQQQQRISEEEHYSNKCDDTSAQSAGTRHGGRRSAVAAQLDDMQDDDEPHSAPVRGSTQSSRVAWEDGAASDGDLDDAGSESGAGSEDDDTEVPDAAELMAKVDALGAGLGSVVDGIAALHLKVGTVAAVLTAVLQAAGGTSRAK